METALSQQISSGVTRVLPLVHRVDDQVLMEELPIVAARKFERLADDPEPDLPRIAWKVQVRLQEQATPRLVTLEEIDGHLGTAEHRIRSCRRGFRVLGNDNKFIVESRSHILEEALDRGITVRVMCVAPRSIGSETLQIIDPRFPKAGDFEKSMGPVEEILRRLRDAYGGLLDFRYLRIAPAMGLFITDPDDPNHGVVKVEIYGIQPFKPLGSRPHLLLGPAMEDWRRYFIQQWDNYWAVAERVP